MLLACRKKQQCSIENRAGKYLDRIEQEGGLQVRQVQAD